MERIAVAGARADAAEVDTGARDEAMRQMLNEILNPKLRFLMTNSGDAGDEGDGDETVRPNRLASTAAASMDMDPQAVALAAEARDVRKEAAFIGRDMMSRRLSFFLHSLTMRRRVRSSLLTLS